MLFQKRRPLLNDCVELVTADFAGWSHVPPVNLEDEEGALAPLALTAVRPDALQEAAGRGQGFIGIGRRLVGYAEGS